MVYKGIHICIRVFKWKTQGVINKEWCKPENNKIPTNRKVKYIIEVETI